MSMITQALSTYAGTVAAATSLPVTTDPSAVIPPCIYVAAPSVTGRTQGGLVMEVPVHLVAEGIGDSIALAWHLAHLEDFLTATQAPTAFPSNINVDGITHPTYQATTTISVRSTTP